MSFETEAVIIALGTSLQGDHPAPEGPLAAALEALAAAGSRPRKVSRVWRSLAWPDPLDPPFLNAVALIETREEPSALLASLKRLEAALGRVKGRANGPRLIDLDLIAYGRRIVETPDLILPHPRAADRRFVMGPLAEIAPAWIHPGLGASAADLAGRATVGADAAPWPPGHLDVAPRA